MRYFTKLKKKRFNERLNFNHFLQLWFNYHFLFFHCLILRGLKLRAFTVFSDVKIYIKISQKFDSSFIFLLCMLRITPSLMLKSLKVGGTKYLVPFPIYYWKKIMFGCRWVIKALKEQYRSFYAGIAAKTLIASLYGFGLSYEKKKLVYSYAAYNRHLLRRRAFKR